MSECKYCKSELKPKAKICTTCNNHQNWFIKNIFNITTLLSIAVVIISLMQFLEAKKEREETSVALSKADSSLVAANFALEQSLLLKKEVEKTTLDLLSLIQNTNMYIEENVRGTVTDDSYDTEKVRSLNKKIKTQIDSLRKTLKAN